jgi:hypothetical protein
MIPTDILPVFPGQPVQIIYVPNVIVTYPQVVITPVVPSWDLNPDTTGILRWCP